MIGSPRARGGEEADALEGSVKSPAQLALAMPLIAVGALMVVVSSLALGGSAQLVAIVAVGGFGVCAVAPMALLDIFVGRPLRAAAARLRAARDGRPIQDGAPFAAGIVADLVHLADDIRAGHAQIGKYGATLAQCEKLLVAGEEAIRAFRLQSEELAQATALGDSQLRRATQAQFAEIAEALKALRGATPAANLDGAVERIESMLVYVGEALDRRDANDKVVEQSFSELGRLVTREAEGLQRSVSNSAVMVRNDLALAETEDTSARTRVIERIETAEARLLARLVEAVPPDAARIGELIRAESEATRRALRDKLEETSQKLDAAVANRPSAADDARPREELQRMTSALAAASETLARNLARLDAAPSAAAGVGEIVARGLADIGERLGAETATQAERLEAVESRVVQQILAIERDAEATTLTALMRTTKQLGEAVKTLEATGAGAQGAQVSAQLQGLGKAVEAMAQRLEAAEARDAFATLAPELAGLRESLEAARGEIKAATPESAALRQDLATLGHTLETLAARAEAAMQTEGGRLRDGLGAVSGAVEAVARQAQDGFAATEGRLEDIAGKVGNSAGEADFAALRADLAAALGAQSESVVARLDAFDRDAIAAALAGLEAARRQIAELPARFDGAAEGIDRSAETRAAAGIDFSGLRAEFGDLFAQMSARLDAAARADEDETPPWSGLDPAVAAIQAVTAEFCKAGAQLSASADALKLAAADRPAFAALREDVAALARLGERAEAALRSAADQAQALDSRAEGRAREAERRLQSLEERVTAQLRAFASDAGATLPDAAALTASQGHALGEIAERFAAFAEAQSEASQALDLRLTERAAGHDRASAA